MTRYTFDVTRSTLTVYVDTDAGEDAARAMLADVFDQGVVFDHQAAPGVFVHQATGDAGEITTTAELITAE